MTTRPSLKDSSRDSDRPPSDANQRPWLLLLFSLPTKRNSERVEVWRKLRRVGALPLGPPGYVLPNSGSNGEHFQWLAAAIRGYKGQASVIQVQAIDHLSSEQLIKRFNDARSREYQALIKDLSEPQKG